MRAAEGREAGWSWPGHSASPAASPGDEAVRGQRASPGVAGQGPRSLVALRAHPTGRELSQCSTDDRNDVLNWLMGNMKV